MSDVLTFFYYCVQKLVAFLFDIEIFGVPVGTFLIILSIFSIIVGTLISYTVRGTKTLSAASMLPKSKSLHSTSRPR